MNFQIKVGGKIWETEDLEELYVRLESDAECKEWQVCSSKCLSLTVSWQLYQKLVVDYS